MLTIFTPTYNRAYTLSKLYNSLCNQTCSDFEWLVVDDGSVDGTESLLNLWIKEKLIKIRYVRQENAGKMSAHNVGVCLCETELFLCVDSDDWILPDSVEIILERWNSVKGRADLCGMVAYRYFKKKNGTFQPKACFPSVDYSSLHALYQSGFRGDTSLIFRTEVLRRYLFPTIEKFITEAYVYDQIDQKYVYFVLNKPIIICEYQEDGYTRNSLSLQKNYPIGWAMYYGQYYNFYAKKMKDRVKYAALCMYFSGMAKKNYKKYITPPFYVAFLGAIAKFHYKKIYERSFLE